MRSMIASIGVGLLLGMAPGCGSGEPERVAAAPAATWEAVVVERSEGRCEPDAAGPCAHFRVEYPRFVGGPEGSLEPLNAGIREMLLSPALGAAEPAGLEAMGDRFLSEWRKARAELPGAASTARWFVRTRVAVIYQDRRLLSVESAEATFMGGAHPNSVTRYASFDLTDGSRMTLDRLLIPNHAAQLGPIAERRFRQAREIPAQQSLSDAGFWFEQDGFTLNENFAVTAEGLRFRFDPYEVGPYSLGPTEFSLGLADLEGLILPGGPLERDEQPGP